MKIYYQGIKGAYSHQVWEILKDYFVKKWFDKSIETQWVFSFKDIFENLERNWWIWIIPIENSYAWSVHQNLYLMRDYNVKILAEYYLPVRHCLASLANSISDINQVYSHPQALMQCENFLRRYNFEPIDFLDTAWSAKYVAQKKDNTIAAICSEYAAKLYWLNILKRNINDHPDNTTRFLFVCLNKDYLKFKKFFNKEEKQTIIFKVKDQPAILFKCLWAFATRSINLTKIESIPSKRWNFEYLFWIDFEASKKLDINWALEELHFFTKEIIDLGVYGKL